MFLKNVELFGFKSFANRSKIEFNEGISALLGPNGCGKSNVVDSIKWVLGEQSSKTLRADKMDDVIFNGTETTKPLNVAEVILTLSNDSGILDIDVAEIQIKRRLYRSGESEYFINNTPVRLKELRELFFDTGIGKSAYSIMEQGKIDQILSNKPEERRYIFEEAAGITKFKVKGAEAERKLKKTEENMKQIESILSEVKRNHDSLKRQSEKTIEYRQLKDELFNLECDIQLLKLKSFIEQQTILERELEEKNKARVELKDEIDSINESLEENLDLVNTMETKLIESQKELYGIDLEKNNKESQIQILQERIDEISKQIQTIKFRDEAVKEKISKLKQSKEDKKKELDDYVDRISDIEKNITDFEKNIKASEDKIASNESRIISNEKKISELEDLQDKKQDELRIITDDIVTELEKKLSENSYSLSERKEVEEKLIKGIEALYLNLKGKADIIDDANSINTKARDIFDAIKNEILKGADQINEIKSLFTKYRELVPVFIDEFLAPEGIITKKREIDQLLEKARTESSALKDENRKLRDENRALGIKISEYRKTLEELRLNKVRLGAQKKSLEEYIIRILHDISENETILEENKSEIEKANIRIKSIKEKIDQLKKEKAELEASEKKLKTELSTLEKGITSKNDYLISREKKLKSMMDNLAKMQSVIEKKQVDHASVSTEIKNIHYNFRENYSRDLLEFEERMYEIKEDITDLRKKLGDVKDRQKNLGSVNLMAPEEYAEVKERYDFLNKQLEDLVKGKEDLSKVTKEIKEESSELFLETYNKIKKNFHIMFRRLFGGGRAELKLTDPDNILESGIDIFAQPPGKKLGNISLLSGGERSLAGVALLFATYMVKPSPFCILDEIDAALDEANIGNFVNLLMEFGSSSQFIVITHNKKTVAGAKTLLGVTMEESGISKVVSIKLENTVRV